MCIQDLFNPNQKKKLKGNKLADNSKILNSVICLIAPDFTSDCHNIN